MKVRTIRLYKDTDEIIVEEKRIREFSDLGYRAKPLGERGESRDVGESGKGDGGKGKGRKAKDEAAQDADTTGGA